MDEHGEEISGDTLLILFNADQVVAVDFTLPELEEQRPWQRLLDTSSVEFDEETFNAGQQYALQPASLALFRLEPAEEPGR